MRSYVKARDTLNEIRLLIKHPSYKSMVFMVLEGETDIDLFENLFSDKQIKLKSADGKRRLNAIMRILFKESPDRVIGICDSDFDHLQGIAQDKESYSVYVTDQHDSELMMLDSAAYYSFLKENAQSGVLDNMAEDILGNVLEAVCFLGVLRWINLSETLELKFKGLKLHNIICVEGTSVSIDIEKLLKIVLERSKNRKKYADEDYLRKKLVEYSLRNPCRMQVSQGHDVSNIISMVFRQKEISLDTNMNAAKVESGLRKRYQPSYFMHTELYKKVSTALKGLGVNEILIPQ